MKKEELKYQIRFWRHFLVPMLVLLLLVGAGILGFMVFEKISFLQALYLVAVTLTTVGMRPAENASSWALLFDTVFVVAGVVMVVILLGRALEFVVSGEFVKMRRRRRMEKKIESMKDHYIICGFGRVGHQVAVEFKAAKIPFVVLDSKPETAEELEPQGIPYIVGDITSDRTLLEANIKKAKGLIASADSDTANVFVVLSQEF